MRNPNGLRPTIGPVSTSILVVMMLLATARSALAQAPPASEIDELRREMRLLRSQMQSLRSAIMEAAEIDTQRGNALLRAVKAIPGSDAPVKGREDADDRPRAPVAAPAAAAPSAPSPAPTPVHSSRKSGDTGHKAADVPAPTGVVRGKVTVSKGEPVSYAYVENVTAPLVKDQKQVIEQSGKRFVPAWAVIQRGTVISFPNRDNVYHNVFSLTPGSTFDLGLYSSGDSKSYTFNEPGEVEIFCNIHPQMAANALVLPNKLYAKVKPDGTFEIAGVPTGKRKIVAWSPGSRLAATWVDVDSGEVAHVELKLEPKSSSHKNKMGQAYGSYE